MVPVDSLRYERGGALEAFLHESDTANEEFCSFVEALSCPTNDGPAPAAVYGSTLSAGNCIAPKHASYEIQGQATQSNIHEAAESSRWSCSVPQKVIVASNSDRSMVAVMEPDNDASLPAIKLEKIRERNRRSQRAYRERLTVR
jgi:hypothetical protein